MLISASPTRPIHFGIIFESPEIIQQPTYASTRPAGQGLLQAAGKLLGHPWIGVLISAGAMVVLLYWMLCGWVPPNWALLGACLAAMRWCLYTYWMNGYWGGALAACGGALVVGSMGRLMRSARPPNRLGYFLAAGAGLLLVTMPVEGLFLVIPLMAALLLGLRQRALRLVLPMVVILVPVVAWMGYYNWRVTGDVMRTAMDVHRAVYGTETFVSEHHDAEPRFRHPALREFHEWEDKIHRDREAKPFFTMLINLAVGWRFLLGPALTLAALGLGWTLRRRRTFPLLVIGAVCLAAASTETWMHPHALAPVCGLFLVILVQSMRHLHAIRFWGIPYGIVFVRAVVLTCAAMLLVPPINRMLGIRYEVSYGAWWSIEEEPDRPRIYKQLEDTEGKDLVMVRYMPGEPIAQPWVYNEADIDGAGIVWAREMSPEKDQALPGYFAGRRVWLLEPNLKPVQLKAYSPQ